MRYVDPLRLFSFTYPMGWVYAPERSSTETVVFEHFSASDALLRADIFPTSSTNHHDVDSWALAMETLVCERLESEIKLRLLPDMEIASAVERHRGDGRGRRLVGLRGHSVDVAVSVEAAEGPLDPFMDDTIRVVRSSLTHYVNTDRDQLPPQLLQLVWDDWRYGHLPKTRSIIGVTHVVRQKALAELSPEPLFDMAVVLDRHVNSMRALLGDEHSEVRFLRLQLDELAGAIGQIYQHGGFSPPPLGDAVEFAHACVTLILEWQDRRRDDAPLRIAHMHARALADFLMVARRHAGLLPELWRQMTVRTAPSNVYDELPFDVVAGLAWIASVLGDATFELGDRAESHEADALATAALRLLFLQQPEGNVGGTPIRTQFMYRLLARSIHLRADGDPLSMEEADQLRTEVAALDDSGQMSRILPSQEQRAAFDNLMLLPNLPTGARLAPALTHCRNAQMWLALGRENDARKALVSALRELRRLRRNPPPGFADLCVDLAELSHRLAQPDDARSLLGRALEHIQPLPSGSSLRLLRVASDLYSDGERSLATRWADGAGVIADALRVSTRPGEDRIRYADSKYIQDTYNAAVAGHLDNGELYEALSMADRSRGRFLFESLGAGDRSISVHDRLLEKLFTSGVPDVPALGGPTNARLSIESVSEEPGAVQVPKGLPRRLDAFRSAMLDAVTQECALLRAPVALSPLRIAGMSLYLRNIVVYHEEGDDLIAFLLGAKRRSADLDPEVAKFVRSQGPAEYVRLPGCRRRLFDCLETLQQSMGIHGTSRGSPADAVPSVSAALEAALGAVSELIVAPVAPLLDDTVGLTIIPSRGLSLVPWGPLPHPAGGYLVDRHEITVAPSLSILHMLFERRMRGRDAELLAYIAADPELDVRQRLRGLGELPFARDEAQALLSRLDRLGTGRYIRRDGAEATALSYWLEARGASLVHLATHAELMDPAGMSLIHLAGGGFAAYQVADVPLSNGVVFLAACDTGQGRVSADGVIGLGQSFLQAGAEAVVLTLTKVVDAVTAVLADHFYAVLLNAAQPMTVAGALRSAIIATRADLAAGKVVQDGEVVPPDPAYWGAFYVLGHPDARLRLGSDEGG